MGEVTKDLLKSIAILSALSERNLGQAGDTTKYGLVEIRKFLKGEQTLLDADRANSTLTNTTPAAFAVKPF
ncbi:hypothetical protein C0995_006797 [Termitomyces sp. Mi166|nr:hypothetical protein C0995_006797 [Termitomyces sp. Mi166\